MVLQRRWGFGLVDFGIEALKLLRGYLRLARAPRWCRWGGRATDEGLRRGWLAEIVNAGVVWVAVVVFHIREGGLVRGGVARTDLSITRIVAVREKAAGCGYTSNVR